AALDQTRLPAAPELPRMSTRPLPLLAVLAGGLALGPRPAVAAPTTDETAAAPTTDETVAASERELQAGLAAYAEGEFATALEHFERAYGLHPSPDYLYAWAQAARSSGDCATAVDLYRRFTDAGATGASLEAARQNEIRCAEQLAAEAEAEAPPVTESEPTPELPPVEDDPPPPPPPRRDRLGLAFVITGGVAAGVGVGLLAVAGARQATQADQTSYQRFDELDPGIDRLYAV